MSPSALPVVPTHSIASIPADGIGPEVIEAGIKVLDTLSNTLGTFKLNFTHYDWSSETYKKTGSYIPDGGLEQLQKHDAILFGAVGAPGSFVVFIQMSCTVLISRRCPGPHFTLGSPSRHLPAVSTVRKCSTNQNLQ